MQVPPMVSALKHRGQPLYKLAETRPRDRTGSARDRDF